MHACMTRRVKGLQNSVLNQSGSVRASSPLHTQQKEWEGKNKFSLESDLNQFWIRSESYLNQIWITSESVLNQIWISFDSDFECTSFLLQSTVNYREMVSQLPRNISMAPNPGPKETYSGKRESNWPLIQDFPKYEIYILLELKA